MLIRSSKVLEEIRELVRIISSAGPQKRRGMSLNILKTSESYSAHLYRILEEDSISADHVIYDLLVSQSDAVRGRAPKAISRPIFNSLKSRLKSSLLDTVFLLDLGIAGYSQYSTTLFSVNREVFLARVLSSLSARKLAVSISKNGLPKAIRIEEWSSAMEFLAILRWNASQSGDSKAHAFYCQEYQHCIELLRAEQSAEIQVEQLQLAYAKTGGEKTDHISVTKAAAETVDGLAMQHPSFKLEFLSLRLHSAVTQMLMDHRATIAICEKALALLDRYPIFSNKARQAEYSILMLASASQVHEEEIAHQAIVRCYSTILSTENKWFTFKEYEFLFLMRQLQFKEAYNVVKSVTSHERFRIQPEVIQEKWGLFQLYAEFVNHERVPIQTPKDFSALVPNLTPDKTGYNTAMLILHILLLSERQQFAELRERIEFLKRYKRRYLRGPSNNHAAHFLSMLSVIETSDLNYKKIVRRASKSLVELQRMEANEPIQGELILPYSWVWKYLMDRLKLYHVIAHKEQEQIP